MPARLAVVTLLLDCVLGAAAGTAHAPDSLTSGTFHQPVASLARLCRPPCTNKVVGQREGLPRRGTARLPGVVVAGRWAAGRWPQVRAHSSRQLCLRGAGEDGEGGAEEAGSVAGGGDGCGRSEEEKEARDAVVKAGAGLDAGGDGEDVRTWERDDGERDLLAAAQDMCCRAWMGCPAPPLSPPLSPAQTHARARARTHAHAHTHRQGLGDGARWPAWTS